MRKHLEEAATVGINALFTSLQLPEADKDYLLQDFPVTVEIAHSYGMKIFSLFESGDCSGDSVHPNDMGATVIAQNIIKLIKERNLLK
jgi:hypothetical protein